MSIDSAVLPPPEIVEDSDVYDDDPLEPLPENEIPDDIEIEVPEEDIIVETPEKTIENQRDNFKHIIVNRSDYTAEREHFDYGVKNIRLKHPGSEDIILKKKDVLAVVNGTAHVHDLHFSINPFDDETLQIDILSVPDVPEKVEEEPLL